MAHNRTAPNHAGQDHAGQNRTGPALEAMDVSGRLSRLQARLSELGCSGLLVTKLVNIEYLTGFTGSAGLLLVASDEALLLTDGRYRDQSATEVAKARSPVRIEIARAVAQLDVLDAAARGLGKLGLEADAVTWGAMRRLSAKLSGNPELVPVRHAVEALRAVKDPGELARIERAADLADVALAQVKELLATSPTERELALALEVEMRGRGADGISFETIVASGPNSALPHGRPTERRIEPGDLVVVDFGAEVGGYRSDMTRTLCVGEPATEELRNVLEAVLGAQRAGVRALRAGVSGGEVDAVCRSFLEQAGLADAFTHGTGHGVGLEIHEAPSLGAGSADILEEGSVVTVEPGAYLMSRGGARIEDTLVVTAAGARPLTKSTKDSTC